MSFVRKRLQTIGDGFGLIIDQPMLDQLGITSDTELDISTDGERLVVTPIGGDSARRGRVARAQSRTLARHAETFRKLAQ